MMLLESTLRSKKIKCELKLDASLGSPAGKGKGHPVKVDEHQVQQVLMNLILNAVAASSERQPIIIETRNHPERVECRIRDYGSGIPAEVRKNLFEPFFTTKKDGVGLGLYLSRILIADNHGGSIEIESSSPGKGTTFAIRLPKSS
jgi:signal transduction histidine kinase